MRVSTRFAGSPGSSAAVSPALPMDFVYYNFDPTTLTATKAVEENGLITAVPAPADGFLVGINVSASPALTAGQITFRPTLDGSYFSAADLDIVLTGEDNAQIIASGNANFAVSKGEELGIKFLGDAASLPAVVDVQVRLIYQTT